jgi:hypothetical protein
MAVPSQPTAVHATAGNRSIQVRWGKPADNGGHAITQYLVEIFDNTHPTARRVQFVDSKTFTFTFKDLPNGVLQHGRVFAKNSDGWGPGNSSADVTPAVPPPTIDVTVTKIGPDKVANTRSGQSLPDGPRISVKGTNLDQQWGADADHKLEWVLYTNTGFGTVVGTSTPYVADSSNGALSLSSPIAPGGADIDSNHLIGPWRLKVKWVPDATHPNATDVVYSPAFYTTAVGSVVIGTVAPNPVQDGDTVTVSGPDVGICTHAIVIVGGNTLIAPVTTVDQDHATFVMPTFALQGAAAGTVELQYKLNGNVMGTGTHAITYDPTTETGDGSGSTYEPPEAADINAGDQEYPVIVKRWVFTDAVTGDTYTVPRNPDNMTSPFPERNVQSKFTTAITGQVLLTEGAPVISQWQFSGKVADARHYEQLRHWVNDVNHRVVITDHYGRDILCVLTKFDARPKRDMHRLWSHEYTVTALVLKVGEPTVVPA